MSRRIPERIVNTVAIVAGLLAVVASPETWATQVFGTIFSNPGEIVSIDSTSGIVTPLETTGSSPDSIIFDSSGRLVYTLFGANQLRRFDPTTHSDVLVASGFS